MTQWIDSHHADQVGQTRKKQSRCLSMSDFSDYEDRLLVQFALAYERQGDRISWDELTMRMRDEGSRRSKYVLQQRLKTLKRTHGKQVNQFPRWFFRKALVEPNAKSKSVANPTGKAAARAKSGDAAQTLSLSGCPTKRRKLSVLCKPGTVLMRAMTPAPTKLGHLTYANLFESQLPHAPASSSQAPLAPLPLLLLASVATGHQ